MRAAYFDCLSGASGNMLLGAFLDAGAPLEVLTRTLDALGLSDSAEVIASQRMKGNLRATHVEIEVKHPKPWRHVGEIDRLIAGAALDEGVKERSRLAFRLLAEAEGRAHNIEPDRVRLHEAGAIDAVIDVVGTFALAHELGVDAFFCSALPLSAGETVSEHGRIPLPAPATLKILEYVGAPTYSREGGAELVTPTGAAILGACARFESPRVDTELEGYGAGTADLDWPNVLRLVVGDVEETSGDDATTLAGTAGSAATAPLIDPDRGLGVDTVAVLETNIDDMPANLLADVVGAMIDDGALDAFLTPIVMKKGRSAHLVTVICHPADAPRLAERLVRETPTLGVRVRDQRRWIADRQIQRFVSTIGEIGVKLKVIDGEVLDAVPEHDDVVARATEAGIPVADAHRRAGEEARRQFVSPAALASTPGTPGARTGRTS
ncbi:MAG: nickel pincer cofactor biosynthesis protein LarC [Candidatus Dormibacteria bacterium]